MRQYTDTTSPARPSFRPGTGGKSSAVGVYGPLSRAFLLLSFIAVAGMAAAAPGLSLAESFAIADKFAEAKRWDRVVMTIDGLVGQMEGDLTRTTAEKKADRAEAESRIENAAAALLVPIDQSIEAFLAARGTGNARKSQDRAVADLASFIKLFGNWPKQLDAARTRVAILETANPDLAGSMAKSELDLVLARALVDQKRYSDALDALIAFSVTYPDRFDDSRPLIARVLKERELYNMAVIALHDTLETDPDNEELQNRLLNEAISLNPFPDKVTATQLTHLNVGIGLKVADLTFIGIMEKALRELEAEDWSAAMTTYAGSFDQLYREAFNVQYPLAPAGVPLPVRSSIRATVDILLEAVLVSVRQFTATQTDLSGATRALIAAFDTGNPAAAGLALDRVRPLLEAESARQDLFLAAGRDVDLLRTRSLDLELDSAVNEANFFLFYLYRLIVGRPAGERGGEESPEGMTGILSRQWESILVPISSALNARLEAAWEKAENAWEEGRLADAAAAFDDVAAIAVPGLEVLGIHARIGTSQLRVAAAGVSPDPALVLSWERCSYLGHLATAQAHLARLYDAGDRVLAAARERIAALEAAGPLTEAGIAAERSRFQSWITALADRSTVLEQDKHLALALSAEHAAWMARGGDPRFSTAQSTYEERLTQGLEKAHGEESFVVAATIAMEWRSIDADYQARSSVLAEGRRLLEGIEDPPLGMVSYPTKSATILAGEELGLARIRARIAELLLTRIGKQPAWVISSPAILGWSEQLRNLDRGIAGLQATRLSLLSQARERAGQALVARRDGDTRQQDVRQALQRSDLTLVDYESLLTRLKVMQDRYSTSLGLEYDTALASVTSAAYSDLLGRILDGREILAVRETRRLISSAISLYSGKSYAAAQDNLVAAQSLWTRISPDVENTEITRWLALTRDAIAANKVTN